MFSRLLELSYVQGCKRLYSLLDNCASDYELLERVCAVIKLIPHGRMDFSRAYESWANSVLELLERLPETYTEESCDEILRMACPALVNLGRIDTALERVRGVEDIHSRNLVLGDTIKFMLEKKMLAEVPRFISELEEVSSLYAADRCKAMTWYAEALRNCGELRQAKEQIRGAVDAAIQHWDIYTKEGALDAALTILGTDSKAKLVALVDTMKADDKTGREHKQGAYAKICMTFAREEPALAIELAHSMKTRGQRARLLVAAGAVIIEHGDNRLGCEILADGLRGLQIKTLKENDLDILVSTGRAIASAPCTDSVHRYLKMCVEFASFDGCRDRGMFFEKCELSIQPILAVADRELTGALLAVFDLDHRWWF